MSSPITSSRKTRPAAKTASVSNPSFPLMETGYHLKQAEFHRRYQLMPEVKRAELIEGVVFMGSPMTVAHAEAVGQISLWLGSYTTETPGVATGAGASVILDNDNEYQPDIHLRILPEKGGQTGLVDGKYVRGAPELVVEVALSSLAHDLHEKLAVYRRNGVREYIVWALPDREIRWFNFTSGEVTRLVANRAGLLCSQAFPGLWLDASALIASELKKVLTALRRGLAGAEHVAFVTQLSAAK